MERFDKYLYKGLYSICSFLMLSMALLIFYQVIARYVLHNSLTWSEELGRYIFVWMSFLGISIAIKEGAHVALDILVKKLHGQARTTLILINAALVSILALTITYSGFKMMAWGAKQTSAALKLPMQYVYIVMPIGGMLLLYFVIRQTILDLSKKEEPK